MNRGEVWWAALREPQGSEPGYRRPVVIVQSDDFNRSGIHTVIAAAVTSNTRLARAPGNIFVRKKEAGLPRDSVINVSQLITVNKSFLIRRIGRLSRQHCHQLDDGLRLALSL
jgi:mRNA interferase MazF